MLQPKRFSKLTDSKRRIFKVKMYFPKKEKEFNHNHQSEVVVSFVVGQDDFLTDILIQKYI